MYIRNTRNTFRRENMKNTNIAFYYFKQYLSIDIYMDIYRCTSEVMEIHLQYFVFFSCSSWIKLLNNLNNLENQYLDIGRDDDDDYDDGESSNKDYYK